MSENVTTKKFTEMLDEAYAACEEAQAVLDERQLDVMNANCLRETAQHEVEKATRKLRGLLGRD